MKKIISVLLCAVLLCGCSAIKSLVPQKQHTATFITLFDTVTKIVGSADSEEAFKQQIQPLYDELERYHRLFDIYEEYDGIANLKTVNDKAAVGPVKVDRAILDLLSDAKKYYTDTNGAFNPAMGSVLSLWHTAREDGFNDPQNAYLPDKDALLSAAEHTDPENIVLDYENSTVFISDDKLKIDVGAIAKGWAVQKACQNAPKNLLVSVGGNVCATGAKDQDGTPWSVGITDPKGGDNLYVLDITHGSVVTSGSYQRAYAVDGKLYHHIIDPNTLYPSEYWTSVTIICDDSGLADVLSTSLFLLDQRAGQQLLDRFDAEALWVDSDGKQYYSPDFKSLIKN